MKSCQRSVYDNFILFYFGKNVDILKKKAFPCVKLALPTTIEIQSSQLFLTDTIVSTSHLCV